MHIYEFFYTFEMNLKTRTMKELQKQRWSRKMKNAHRMARGITYLDTMKGKPYRERLSLAMKVQHLLDTFLFVDDVNFLRNALGRNFVRIHLEHLKKGRLFVITGGITEIDIYHYVAPRTVDQDEKLIEVMIESEIKSGATLNLD